MLSFRAITLVLLAILMACNPTQVQNPRTSPQNYPVEEKSATAVTDAIESGMVASLIDPVKLSTLKDRGSNPRIHKITAILYTAKQTGKDPTAIVAGAIEKIGWSGTEKGKITTAAILRNVDILEKLGSTTAEDIEAMRRGRSPKVRKGPYTGDILSVDHIIPRAIVPGLDTVIANLELMPLRLNQSKSDKMGDRQRDLLRKFKAAGLLADPGKFR
jgi:hypothetical protein